MRVTFSQGEEFMNKRSKHPGLYATEILDTSLGAREAWTLKQNSAADMSSLGRDPKPRA